MFVSRDSSLHLFLNTIPTPLQLLIFTFFTLFITSHSWNEAAAENSELRHTIISLNQVRASYANGQSETSDPALRHEELRFADFLQYRINLYCRELLEKEGVEAIDQLPCPEEATLAIRPGKNTSQTSTEAVSQLDASLLEALGDFDEMLLKEEEHINVKKGHTSEGAAGGPGSSAGGSGMTGTGNGAGLAGQGNNGSASQGSDTQQSTATLNEGPQTQTGSKDSTAQPVGKGGDTTSDPAAGSGSGTAGAVTGSQKMDSINTSNDDIVARQLREAAENETNPELKRKLWEEYRRYKGVDTK
ncbi:MAG: hypothetical protein OEM02_07065 [Desulfobulbaceae bacterium]|nr:hypothetical protein [Desulfobulbaceae bacterium]